MADKELIDAALSRASNAGTGMYAVTQYLFFVSLGIWGGAVRYLRKAMDRPGQWWKSPKFYRDLLIESFTSAFVGLVVLFICMWLGYSIVLTAAIVAVAGHQGGSAIELIIKIVERRAGL